MLFFRKYAFGIGQIKYLYILKATTKDSIFLIFFFLVRHSIAFTVTIVMTKISGLHLVKVRIKWPGITIKVKVTMDIASVTG